MAVYFIRYNSSSNMNIPNAKSEKCQKIENSDSANGHYRSPFAHELSWLLYNLYIWKHFHIWNNLSPLQP